MLLNNTDWRSEKSMEEFITDWRSEKSMGEASVLVVAADLRVVFQIRSPMKQAIQTIPFLYSFNEPKLVVDGLVVLLDVLVIAKIQF